MNSLLTLALAGFLSTTSLLVLPVQAAAGTSFLSDHLILVDDDDDDDDDRRSYRRYDLDDDHRWSRYRSYRSYRGDDDDDDDDDD